MEEGTIMEGITMTDVITTMGTVTETDTTIMEDTDTTTAAVTVQK